MIEIISHPGPDRSVTIQGLKDFKVYSRRYRNRRIGEFLKELHLTEGRNTGFKKILDALKANGSPLPEFETDEAHDYFVTRLFIREGFYDEEAGSDDKGSGTTLKLPINYPKNETQLKIIDLIKNDVYITQKEIAGTLGMSVDGVKYHIKKMTDQGTIRREGPKKGGYWVVI